MLDLTNAMSVDVEDYFHVSAFEDHIRREDWDRLPCRVEDNVTRVLALFERHGVHTNTPFISTSIFLMFLPLDLPNSEADSQCKNPLVITVTKKLSELATV